MNNLIVITIASSIVFFFVKFIQMRFIDRETESIKVILKETIFVMISTMLGGFVASQVGYSITSGKILSTGDTSTPVKAFVGTPDF
jgi:hypothetical protein|tara:strand:+ start:7900 stop:8157 length:258 start_codon:yes stop_codon:yes gene_type:complete